MKRIIVIMIFAVFMSGCIVGFDDPILEAEIRDQLGKGPDDIVFGNEMLAITEIDLVGAGLYDLFPLHYATNMSVLRVSDNSIASLQIFTYMLDRTNIKEVYVDNNLIAYFDPLALCPNIDKFWGHNNRMENIDFVTGWTAPSGMKLNGNPLRDISPLLDTNWPPPVLIDVRNCPLNVNSCTVVIPILMSRGYVVAHSCF